MLRWQIINSIAARIGARRYLEIGVEDGHCANRIDIPHRIGVDPTKTSGAIAACTEFHEMTSDDFFSEQTKSLDLDLCLVDGLHHADQAWRDAVNCLNHLRRGGYVIMHDCLPDAELTQRVPREVVVWTGDVWRAVAGLRRTGEVKAHVIETDWGVGIISRQSWPRSALSKPWEDLQWGDFVAHKHELLGLLPVGMWERAL